MLERLTRRVKRRAAQQALIAYPKVLGRSADLVVKLIEQLPQDEMERIRERWGKTGPVRIMAPEEAQAAGIMAAPNNEEASSQPGADPPLIATMREVEGEVRLGSSNDGCRCNPAITAHAMQVAGMAGVFHIHVAHDPWCPLLQRRNDEGDERAAEAQA